MLEHAAHVAVMTTPIDPAGRPDWEGIAQATDNLCRTPAQVLFPCASTGEFVHFDRAENKRILQVTAEANRGRKLLFAGIAASTLAGSLEYLEEAKRLGYDGCVACPPYYYPMTQEDTFAYYRQLTQAAEGLPILGYHVPFFTTGIELDTFDKLLDLPGFVGMKDSSALMKRIGHEVRLTAKRPDFRLYTGTDDCLLPALVCGCKGSMTAFGASLPHHIGAVYAAYEQGDFDTARRLQQKMMPLLALADTLPFPLGYKIVAEETGMVKPSAVYLQVCDPQKVAAVRRGVREMLDAWDQ